MQIEYLLIIGISVIILFMNFRENLEQVSPKQKNINNLVICKNCKSWNHRDAYSKCTRTCKTQFPDKKISFTGNWTKVNENDTSCECSFQGNFNKKYIGCPSKKSLKQCFIWNQEEANQICQPMCNKFLPNVNPKWTGNWKSTSAETSACECEYYD